MPGPQIEIRGGSHGGFGGAQLQDAMSVGIGVAAFENAANLADAMAKTLA